MTSNSAAALMIITLLLAAAGVANSQDAKKEGMARKQTRIKGLLVSELPNGELAGVASQMNATALKEDVDGVQVEFNQDVGDMMTGALKEVVKFLRVRHDQWPDGYNVEIAFEDKFTPKDGPSAAVVCALMLDSLMTGDNIDPMVAITGDMNADGGVQPVGGVPAKIRGARAKDCSIVGIPKDNVSSITDLVLMEGVRSVSHIQIFSLDTYEEAAAIAAEKKPEVTAKAIADFAMVQKAYQSRGDGVLRNAKVQAKLKEVLKGAPNHVSARLMLAKATGRLPKNLSLLGSLENIETSAAALLSAARAGRANKDALAPDDLADAVAELRRVRGKLDKRTWSYADSIQDFGKLVRDFQQAPPRGAPTLRKKISEINASANRIDIEVDKIRGNKAMMEELMQE